MTEEQLLARIVTRPDVFGGKPSLRHRRLAVEHILGMLAAGQEPDALLDAFKGLDRADLQACYLYSFRVLSGETIPPPSAPGGQP